MTTLPPDGGIAPTDTVGQQLIERTRSLDSARRKAAAELIDNDGEFCSFVDTMRATQGDRTVRPGDLHLFSDAQGSDLLRLALAPLHAPPPSWAVPTSENELLDSVGETARHYVRQLTWSSAAEFAIEMVAFQKRFPAEAPRIVVLVEEAKKEPNRPVRIRYFGTTTMSTPDGRAQDDGKRTGGTFWCNLTAMTSRPVEVFLLEGLESPCVGREYRERSDLHATERALMATIAPLMGNSARGGFHHEPDLSQYDKVDLPPFDDPNEPETIDALAKLNTKVQEHLEDSREYWERARGVKPISKAAFDSMVDSALVHGLVRGAVVNVRLGKHIPEEARYGEDRRLAYFGAHCGPGPAISRSIISSLGDTPKDDVERHAFGAFVDL